jgi:hypothetical protein
MKIRTGFVSNSSSSSFIVGFQQIPRSAGEVLDILGISSGDIAYRIFEDIQNSKPATKKQIKDVISGGYFDGYPMMDYNRRDEASLFRIEFNEKNGKDVYDDEDAKEKYLKMCNKKYKEHDKIVKKAAQILFDREMPKLKGLKIFIFSYGDENGELDGQIEHGNTFRNVPHIAVSYH